MTGIQLKANAKLEQINRIQLRILKKRRVSVTYQKLSMFHRIWTKQKMNKFLLLSKLLASMDVLDDQCSWQRLF